MASRSEIRRHLEDIVSTQFRYLAAKAKCMILDKDDAALLKTLTALLAEVENQDTVDENKLASLPTAELIKIVGK